jgi:magnesium chelatase family protein
MSLAKIYSGAVYGVDAYPVEIEVNAGGGEPMMILVGLPDAAVRESKDRVWTALINSGFWPPDGRTTVNLAPADIKKEGPSFDLPIALGMLAANKDIEKEALEGVCAVGKLALSPSMNSGQAGASGAWGFAAGDAGAQRRTAHVAGAGGERGRGGGGQGTEGLCHR